MPDHQESVAIKRNSKESKFSSQKMEKKESDGEFYTKGYIATSHIDTSGDKIAKETLNVWAQEINENQSDTAVVSIHHDRDDVNLIGLGQNARVDKLADGEYGLFVETHYNKTHPEFDKVKYNIDNGFIGNYSIEYDTQDNSTTHSDYINNQWVRVLEPETSLVGYGLASPRTAVNKEAKLFKEEYKELFHLKEAHMDKKHEDMEDEDHKKKKKKMEEEHMSDAKKEDAAQPAQVEAKEAPQPVTAQPVIELKAEMKEALIKDAVKEIKETLLKEIQAKSPLINEQKEQQKIQVKEVANFKESMEKGSYHQKWQSAAKLHSFLDSKGAIAGMGKEAKSLPFECKEGKIEFKDLQTDTNYVGAQTAFYSILSNYEQYPAELNSIYQPVIIEHLNNAVTTWSILPKVDFSRSSAITFRARTARNTTAAGYTEATAVTSLVNTDFSGNITRRKFNLPFSYYRVLVSVSGPELSLAASEGGIGDVYADEVQKSTEDLLRVLNLAVIGTGDGTLENVALGFEGLIRTTGAVYGKTVTDAGYTTLAAAGKDNMASAAITLKKMREMMDTAIINGAQVQNLVFITSYTQNRFIKALVQDMQRTQPTSGRFGITGLLEFDGVTIFPDQHVNTDDLFLIDISVTKIGIKVPPMYEEHGKDSDGRRGHIKTYWNLYCEAPNHNYWIHTLATS